MGLPRSNQAAPAAAPAPRRSVLLGLLIFTVLVLLALILLPPLVSLRAIAVEADLEQHRALAARLADTEASLQQLQAGARGYIITQSPAFRAQYRAAAATLPAQLQQLVAAGAPAEPPLNAQLAELAAAIDRWQREGLDQQVALVEGGRPAAAAAALAGGESQGRFDAIRERLKGLQSRLQAAEVQLAARAAHARTLQVLTSDLLGVLGLGALAAVSAGFLRLVALTRALAAAQDRAARIAAETAAQLAEAAAERQRLQAIFDHSPAGVVVAAAPGGRLVLVNRRARALVGAPAPGATLCEHAFAGRVFGPGGEPLAPEQLPLAATLADGKARDSVELLVAGPEGIRAPVLMTTTPLRDGRGALTGAVAEIQHARRPPGSVIQTDGLAVDLARHHVTVDGQEVGLTPTEYGILAFLARHAGQVLSHEQILKAVWGDAYGGESNYLWVHVAHVRQKIEADPREPRYIITERGVGYRLAKL